MMRNVIIAFVAILFSSGVVRAEKDMALLGVGVIVATSPYAGVGTTSTMVPVVKWEFKGVYIQGVELGYTLLKKDAWSVKALVAPRFMGYHSSDSDQLAGMEDRMSSFDAGFGVDYALPFGKDLSLGAKYVTDVGGRHDGQEFDLALSKRIVGKIFRLTPSIGVKVQSGNMVDYYYGVLSNEVAVGRSSYEPGAAVNGFGGVMFNIGIHKDWIVMTRAGVEVLGQEITDSPIVERDVLFSGVIGLTRRF